MANNIDQFQTSEKIKLDYEIANIWVRFGAHAIDVLIQGAVIAVLYILIMFMIVGGAALQEVLEEMSDGILVVFVIIIILLILGLSSYKLIFEWAWKGQTPGKRVMNIRVIHDDGSQIKASSVILRNLFRIIDMLPMSYITGTITMLINKQNKRIGDLVAGTIVVVENKVSLPTYADPIRLDCFAELMGTDVKSVFSEKELQIIETYYSSRFDLAANALNRIEAEIVMIIEKNTNIARPAGISAKNFIGALYGLLE